MNIKSLSFFENAIKKYGIVSAITSNSYHNTTSVVGMLDGSCGHIWTKSTNWSDPNLVQRHMFMVHSGDGTSSSCNDDFLRVA